MPRMKSLPRPKGVKVFTPRFVEGVYIAKNQRNAEYPKMWDARQDMQYPYMVYLFDTTKPDSDAEKIIPFRKFMKNYYLHAKTSGRFVDTYLHVRKRGK